MPPACCSNLSSSTWQLRSEDPWTTCFSAPERLRKNVLYGIEEGLARHRVRLIKLSSLPLRNLPPEKARQQQPLSLVSPPPRRTLRCHPGQANPTRLPVRQGHSWQNPIECLPYIRSRIPFPPFQALTGLSDRATWSKVNRHSR